MKKRWAFALIPLFALFFIAQFTFDFGNGDDDDHDERDNGGGIYIPSFEDIQRSTETFRPVVPADSEITRMCDTKNSRWVRFRLGKKNMGGWQCISLNGVDVIDNPVTKSVMQQKRKSHDFYLRNNNDYTISAKVDVNILRPGEPPPNYYGNLIYRSARWFRVRPGQVLHIGTLTEAAQIGRPQIELRKPPPIRVRMNLRVRAEPGR